MPAVRAERLCPEAIFVAPDFTRYRAVSCSVKEIFKGHTDLIEATVARRGLPRCHPEQEGPTDRHPCGTHDP